MPRSPLLGECHGGIPFAKHFRNSIHKFREVLHLFGGEILAKPRMQSPSGFDFFSGHIGHHADEFDLIARLTSSARQARSRPRYR